MRTQRIIALTLSFAFAGSALAQDAFKERLEKSPRHHEWVKIKHGERTLTCFVVFPEVKNKALSVVVIHENKGLTDFARATADQLAEAGYIAIAPDCLSEMGPKKGNTDAFASMGDATKAIGKLPPDQVTADLNAAADYVKKLPAANGKVAVCGFCWGGMQTFRFATNRKDIEAAFVFYGTAPDSDDALAKIQAPVYGFYGGNDARVNATLDKTEAGMKAAGKKFDKVIYDGAGHGFFRSGAEPMAMEANVRARAAAWERWQKALKAIQ